MSDQTIVPRQSLVTDQEEIIRQAQEVHAHVAGAMMEVVRHGATQIINALRVATTSCEAAVHLAAFKARNATVSALVEDIAEQRAQLEQTLAKTSSKPLKAHLQKQLERLVQREADLVAKLDETTDENLLEEKK